MVLDGELTDEASLILSGSLDSLGLLNLALFIEGEIGYKLEVIDFDPAKEWNTISDILSFIVRLRESA
jgi:acyl carrier protein